jgi:hypothetical protein
MKIHWMMYMDFPKKELTSSLEYTEFFLVVFYKFASANSKSQNFNLTKDSIVLSSNLTSTSKVGPVVDE